MRGWIQDGYGGINIDFLHFEKMVTIFALSIAFHSSITLIDTYVLVPSILMFDVILFVSCVKNVFCSPKTFEIVCIVIL